MAHTVMALRRSAPKKEETSNQYILSILIIAFIHAKIHTTYSIKVIAHRGMLRPSPSRSPKNACKRRPRSFSSSSSFTIDSKPAVWRGSADGILCGACRSPRVRTLTIGRFTRGGATAAFKASSSRLRHSDAIALVLLNQDEVRVEDADWPDEIESSERSLTCSMPNTKDTTRKST